MKRPFLGYVEEVRTLGARRTLFRLLWEGAARYGWFERLELHRRPVPVAAVEGASLDALPFSRLVDVARVPGARRDECVSVARRAAQGAIRCFGSWTADFGQPIDWYVDPVSGRRWAPQVHWSRALGGDVGDVKIAWELGRFPHAFHLARAAVYEPTLRETFAGALEAQLTSFLAGAPYGRGIHWSSGQELVVRLMAWLFGAHVLGPLRADVRSAVVRYAVDVGRHLDWYVVHSKYAVHNNHLLADALGLLLCAWLAPTWPDADRWRREAVHVLSEQAEVQFRADGGYVQNSHNYHRVALQYLVWAHVFTDASGQAAPVEWRSALERSLELLVAHQDPVTGRLPNYGANDGALPAILSTCEFSDFRPTLQTVSLLVRGERLYEPGPWDEEAAWLLGDEALRAAPLRRPARQSVSFGESGYHVLRGRDERSFAAFRCGSILDRFSQIDMLHVDLWWRGENVLVDGGSYLYNGGPEWNAHFVGTASHNTITVDGHDQMLLWRKFKCLYWTRARLLAVERREGWSLVAGEHVGFERHPGRCVHRRAVLLVNDDLWIVLDRVHGRGVHDVRLHWLAGPYPFTYDEDAGLLRLETGAGEFTVSVFDRVGRPLTGDVVRGRECPPRGWLSRHYGEKVAVPSLAVVQRADMPAMFLTVLAGGGRPRVDLAGEDVLVEHGAVAVRFQLGEGVPRDVVVTTHPEAV